MLPTTTSVDFSETNDVDSTTFSLQRNERRDLTTFDRSRLDVTMRLTPNGAEIVNRTDAELEAAYILLGDETYVIPVIEIGTHTYPLVNGYLRGETSALLRALQNWFPLRHGGSSWLLLIEEDDERTLDDEGIHKKVRRVAVSLVEGGRQ